MVFAAFAWSHTLRQRRHDRSRFRAPQMPTRRYVEENGLVAGSAVIIPEMNLRGCVTLTPLLSMNKPAHSNFETQRRRHQKCIIIGVLVVPPKGLMSAKDFKKMYFLYTSYTLHFWIPCGICW